MTMDKESAKTTWYALNSELRQALTEIVLEEQLKPMATLPPMPISDPPQMITLDPELRSLLTEQNKILSKIERNLRLMTPEKYSM